MMVKFEMNVSIFVCKGSINEPQEDFISMYHNLIYGNKILFVVFSDVFRIYII